MAGAPVIDVQVAAGMPFAEAAEAFGSRVPVLTPSVLNSAREFWLSQRAIAAAPVRRTLTKMAQDYLQRYMSGGADSRKGFTQWLSEQNVGITDHYAETVRRAALGNSFSEGRLKQMREHNDRVRSLGGADDVVGFRLMSAGDAAVRPEHAALDGIAFPMTEAGLRFMPPNGFGCRCTYAPVFADEGAQLATEAEMQALERFVDDGWLNAPSSIIEERDSLASRSGRVKLAESDGTRWITVGGGEGSEGGGRRVQIDGQGRILKGLSKGAEGKTLDEAFSDSKATFGEGGGKATSLEGRYKKLVDEVSSGPYRIAYEGSAVSTDGWREEMASARSKKQAVEKARGLVEERGGGSLEQSAISDAENFSDTKKEFVSQVIEGMGRASKKRQESERKLGHLKELMSAGADIDVSSRSEATYVTLPLGEGNYARIRFADHPAVWESSKFAVQAPYEDLWGMSPSEIKDLAQSAPAYAISDLSPADVEEALKQFGDQDTNEKATARGRLLSSRSGPLNSKLSFLLHRMRLTVEETR